MKFSLTLQQLQRLINNADSEEWEDIVTFEIIDGRLVVDQYDWSHQVTKLLMDKPI